MLNPQPYRVLDSDGNEVASGDIQLASGASTTVTVQGYAGNVQFETTGVAPLTVNTVCAEPRLEGVGVCSATQEATFTITNAGGANMINPQPYRVLDSQGNEVASGTIQLMAGESTTVTVQGYAGDVQFETTGVAPLTVNTVCAEPSLEGVGICREDQVAIFTIRNTGGGDMLNPAPFRIVTAGGVEVTTGTVQLAAGQEQQIDVSGFGGTLTLEITEVPGAPITVDTVCAEIVTPTVTPVLPTPTPTPTTPPPPDCASWTVDEDGFPIFDYEMDEECRDPGLPREPWTPIEPGAGVCPIWAVYHTDHTGTWEIFRLGDLPDDPDAPANLSQGFEPGIYSLKPSRSPDNEWIAFTSNRSGTWEIWVAPTNGRTPPRRVTFNQFAITSDPVWSPGGRYIAYESSRDGNWEIYMFDVTTGQETRLTENRATDINPYWRPLQPGEVESTRLVFQSLRDGLWQVYELDLETLDVTRLSDGQGPDRNPQYSHDGQQIVFTTERLGNNSVIALMLADGADVRLISAPAGPALNTSWSEDDRLIAYQSLLPENGTWAIFVYELETELTRQLTSTELQADDRRDASIAPTWYCGTTDVLWASDALGNLEIYTVNALPMDADPINVRLELSPLTRNPGFTNFNPQNTPSEEDASNRATVRPLSR
jgi:hypothetical protein